MAIDPEYQLDDRERAILVSQRSTSLPIIKKIMEAEAQKFNVGLLNANASDDKEVLAAHKLAKAAAQFHVQVWNRVNQEMEIFNCTPKDTDAPLVNESLESLLGGE